MRYELYADSLFVINFVMNLYLLFLVDRSTFRTATPGRLLMGAAFGGFSSLLPFVFSAPGTLKLMLGMAVGAAGSDLRPIRYELLRNGGPKHKDRLRSGGTFLYPGRPPAD